MPCTRAQEIDVAAFAVDPRAAEWAEFRAHFPRCEECSREVARFDTLAAVLRDGETGASAHPSAAQLVALATSPSSLAPEERARLEAHLAGCAPCRTDLGVARGFDFKTLSPGTEWVEGPCVSGGRGSPQRRSWCWRSRPQSCCGETRRVRRSCRRAQRSCAAKRSRSCSRRRRRRSRLSFRRCHSPCSRSRRQSRRRLARRPSPRHRRRRPSRPLRCRSGRAPGARRGRAAGSRAASPARDRRESSHRASAVCAGLAGERALRSDRRRGPRPRRGHGGSRSSRPRARRRDDEAVAHSLLVPSRGDVRTRRSDPRRARRGRSVARARDPGAARGGHPSREPRGARGAPRAGRRLPLVRRAGARSRAALAGSSFWSRDSLCGARTGGERAALGRSWRAVRTSTPSRASGTTPSSSSRAGSMPSRTRPCFASTGLRCSIR